MRYANETLETSAALHCSCVCQVLCGGSPWLEQHRNKHKGRCRKPSGRHVALPVSNVTQRKGVREKTKKKKMWFLILQLILYIFI
ncbi:hypothetical protein E2C01_067763 [Portunus trituberculatus]|uniref:Uncharacterized protein n=1 Tax=Portunus trituberculatus TaxID=210409 RepID=A0A5B7HYA1_PORTR|nr:hypothetical protein [Portunus trituberculatus]